MLLFIDASDCDDLLSGKKEERNVLVAFNKIYDNI
jgi:hypothetical protein